MVTMPTVVTIELLWMMWPPLSMLMRLPCLPCVHGDQGATVSVCDCVTPWLSRLPWSWNVLLNSRDGVSWLPDLHGQDKLYHRPGSWDKTSEWDQEVFSWLRVFCGYDGARRKIGLQPGNHWLPDFKGYDPTIREYCCGCLSLDCYVSPSQDGTSSMYHWPCVEVQI